MSGTTKSEPFLWLIFSAGGVLSAMLVPVLLLIFGVAIPLGWMAPPSYAHLGAVLANPLARLIVLVLCVLSLFHAAHRFRHTVKDGFQIKALDSAVAVVSYSGAIVGSVAAVYLLFMSA
jgi:fumarate reductase subunit D